jgi:hypothetical protein
MKIYASVTCPGGGLASLDGKPLATDASGSLGAGLGAAAQCNGPAEQDLVNMQSDFDFTGSFLGITFRSAGTTLDAMMANDGSPCSITRTGDTRAYDDHCVRLEHTVLTASSVDGLDQPNLGKDDVLAVAYQGITETPAAEPWFASGTLKVTENAWTGTVTYAPPSPPTWTMTNGSDTESGVLANDSSSASGQLIPSDGSASSLRLTNPARALFRVAPLAIIRR